MDQCPAERDRRGVGTHPLRPQRARIAQHDGHHAHLARIELTVPRKPDHFQRICRIVADQGGRLIRAERHLRLKGPGLDVVLHVSAPVIDRLVEGIEGAGYDIDLIVYKR